MLRRRKVPAKVAGMFKAPKNPLAMEATGKIPMGPTPGDAAVQKQQWIIDRIKENEADPSIKMAYKNQVIAEQYKNIDETIRDDFVRGFDAFLVGQMPEGLKNPNWKSQHGGKENGNISMMSDPTVEGYIMGKVEERHKFEKALARMVKFGPIDASGHTNVHIKYLYYKYVLREFAFTESNFLADYKLWRDAFGEDGMGTSVRPYTKFGTPAARDEFDQRETREGRTVSYHQQHPADGFFPTNAQWTRGSNASKKIGDGMRSKADSRYGKGGDGMFAQTDVHDPLDPPVNQVRRTGTMRPFPGRKMHGTRDAKNVKMWFSPLSKAQFRIKGGPDFPVGGSVFGMGRATAGQSGTQSAADLLAFQSYMQEQAERQAAAQEAQRDVFEKAFADHKVGSAPPGDWWKQNQADQDAKHEAAQEAAEQRHLASQKVLMDQLADMQIKFVESQQLSDDDRKHQLDLIRERQRLFQERVDAADKTTDKKGGLPPTPKDMSQIDRHLAEANKTREEWEQYLLGHKPPKYDEMNTNDQIKWLNKLLEEFTGRTTSPDPDEDKKGKGPAGPEPKPKPDPKQGPSPMDDDDDDDDDDGDDSPEVSRLKQQVAELQLKGEQLAAEKEALRQAAEAETNRLNQAGQDLANHAAAVNQANLEHIEAMGNALNITGAQAQELANRLSASIQIAEAERQERLAVEAANYAAAAAYAELRNEAQARLEAQYELIVELHAIASHLTEADLLRIANNVVDMSDDERDKAKDELIAWKTRNPTDELTTDATDRIVDRVKSEFAGKRARPDVDDEPDEETSRALALRRRVNPGRDDNLLEPTDDGGNPEQYQYANLSESARTAITGLAERTPELTRGFIDRVREIYARHMNKPSPENASNMSAALNRALIASFGTNDADSTALVRHYMQGENPLRMAIGGDVPAGFSYTHLLEAMLAGAESIPAQEAVIQLSELLNRAIELPTSASFRGAITGGRGVTTNALQDFEDFAQDDLNYPIPEPQPQPGPGPGPGPGSNAGALPAPGAGPTSVAPMSNDTALAEFNAARQTSDKMAGQINEFMKYETSERALTKNKMVAGRLLNRDEDVLPETGPTKDLIKQAKETITTIDQTGNGWNVLTRQFNQVRAAIEAIPSVLEEMGGDDRVTPQDRMQKIRTLMAAYERLGAAVIELHRKKNPPP